MTDTDELGSFLKIHREFEETQRTVQVENTRKDITKLVLESLEFATKNFGPRRFLIGIVLHDSYPAGHRIYNNSYPVYTAETEQSILVVDTVKHLLEKHAAKYSMHYCHYESHPEKRKSPLHFTIHEGTKGQVRGIIGLKTEADYHTIPYSLFVNQELTSLFAQGEFPVFGSEKSRTNNPKGNDHFPFGYIGTEHVQLDPSIDFHHPEVHKKILIVMVEFP